MTHTNSRHQLHQNHLTSKFNSIRTQKFPPETWHCMATMSSALYNVHVCDVHFILIYKYIFCFIHQSLIFTDRASDSAYRRIPAHIYLYASHLIFSKSHHHHFGKFVWREIARIIFCVMRSKVLLPTLSAMRKINKV